MNDTQQPTPGATAEACELIAANAALLRLFKGEYRDSGGRHSDSLFVRDHLESMFERLAPLLARVAELEADRNICANHADVYRKRLENIDAALKLALPDYDAENDPASVAVGRLHQQLAAAKGAVRALREIEECAAAIRRNIDEEQWTEKQDPLWVPTIHAHAHVIEQDARHCLAACAAAGLAEEGK